MKKILLLLFLVCGIAFAQTPTHSATLTWTDTVNPSGTTYDVYRATAACPTGGVIGTLTYTLLNSTPLSVMTYTDTTVTAATTYCYYLTAVGTTGLQSAPSGTVQGTIPSTFPPGTPTITTK